MLHIKQTYQLRRIRIILEISKDIFASLSNYKKVVSFHAGNVMNIDYDNKLNSDTFIKFWTNQYFRAVGLYHNTFQLSSPLYSSTLVPVNAL